MKAISQSRFGAFNAKSVIELSLAVAFLTIASKTSFAIGPVPLTMQTFAVAVVGAWLGARNGFLAVMSYLALGFSGAPVFATPLCGPAAFFGPTAGYLVCFPLAAAMTGFLAEKGWGGKHVFASFISQYASNMFVLFFGTFWLAASLGIEKAFMVGFTPFVIGALLKSILGAAVLFAFSLSKHK